MSNKEKLIFDPIHGYMDFNPLCLQIIDTSEFQRLRNIKQLGTCYLVFPGASHNRFEHSLGVAFLARKMMLNLQYRQPELNITDRLINLVEIAGLCHDLGHGPFSHIFDHQFIKQFPNIINKEHEQRSGQILKFIIQKYQIDIKGEEIDLILQLINPTTEKKIYPKFLYNIVSNIDNGIDVDKFDYIKRDAYNIGLNFNFDYDRILKQAKVINDTICYPDKVTYELYDLFKIRYQLHLRIYTHPIVRSIEFMIIDTLLLSNNIIEISKSIDNVEKFILINDHILDIIEFLSINNTHLEKAKTIINNIKNRKLNTYIGEVLLRDNDKTEYNYQFFLDNQIIINPDIISESTFIIDRIFLGNEKDPLSKVLFYNTNNSEVFQINKNKISQLLPSNFGETRLRFYCKDHTKKIEIKRLFDKFNLFYDQK